MKRNLAFCAAVLGFLMAILDTTIVNIILPDMMKATNTTVSFISWIVNGYNMSFAVCLLTAAKLADQFGRKKLFIIGMVIFTGSSLLCGLTSDVDQLILLRVLQGIGASIIVPVSIPITLGLFSKEERQTIIGIWGALAAFAGASGPVLGGLISKYLNWHFVFFMNVPIGALAILLTALLIQESYDVTAGKRIDWLGILLLSVSMSTLTYALIMGNDHGWTSSSIEGSFAAAAVSLLLFLVVEIKSKEPMLALHLFRSSYFSCANVTLLLIASAMNGLIFISSFFLTRLMHDSVLQAGLTLASFALGTMVCSAVSGVVSKRGTKPVIVIGILIVILSAYLMGFLTSDSNRLEIISVLVLGGAGNGFCLAPIMSAIIAPVPEHEFGMASGISNMGRTLGSVIGIAVLVAVLTAAMQSNLNEAKKEMIRDVEQNKILMSEAKQAVISKLRAINTSKINNATFKKSNLNEAIDRKVAVIQKTGSIEIEHQIGKAEKRVITAAFSKIDQAGQQQMKQSSGIKMERIIKNQVEEQKKQIQIKINEKAETEKGALIKKLIRKLSGQKSEMDRLITQAQQNMVTAAEHAFSKTFRSISIMMIIALLFSFFSEKKEVKKAASLVGHGF
ncbi:DHA2 family efflux MFS transporter permease subunit [Sporolactobacillus pectinivorans]|uniref:DHA2 family efflux MFS transporter permease subunit n=1 Tax=Sporolactobacillus pectinivorans TaxID=1591408 RepID=UPI000C25795E|nr:DHA2 family efflux MFS transporter permease subunit [Sporolactobacillus pectinivorans]